MLTEKIKLEPDETIIFQVRKHWFVLLTQVFVVVIAGILPLVGYLFFLHADIFSIFKENSTLPVPTLVALYTAWLILIWMALFSIWTNYYLDIWTLTNKRLIAVDQQDLFHRHTSSFRLERLQDMSVEFHGIIETFLDFGTIEADTAGHNGENFRVSGIPKPRELKAQILHAADITMRTDTPDPSKGVGE